MHEESLVRSLIRQVEQIAEQHHAVFVREIRTEAGPLSGVEPVLVQSAFQRITSDHVLCGRAVLLIDEPGLHGECGPCGKSFVLQTAEFLCPHCQSGQIRITRGDDFRLIDVVLETGPGPQL
ncbi:MAG: hydrogenase maturation nickel metallochaperone HypA [Planctomycetaceae bacterium]|nr:hydrogenase maturation nickel metallochaperone HypA [Planctomycetaceae bacterium]